MDTQGLLLCIVVLSASIQDRRGIKLLALKLSRMYSTLSVLFVDGGYSGEKLSGWIKSMFQWTLTVVKRTDKSRFVILPRRWVVERTFGWMNWYRRLSKDYEYSTKSSEYQCKIANIRLMLKRLAAKSRLHDII